MGDASFIQSSFLGGEISKLMQGRVDRPEYRTSMNVCLNGLPTETGGWVRRPGFLFAQTTRRGAAGRVMKFEFDTSQPYTLEFTDGHLRFRNGLTLVTNNEAAAVSSISSADPAVAIVGASMSWATGDEAYFSGLLAQVPALQNRVFQITRIDGTHFSLADGVTGQPVDGASLNGATIVAGSIAKVLDIATPYVGGIWSTLRSVQTEEVAFLLTSTVKPYALQATPEPVGSNRFASFSLAAATFLDGPYLDPDKSGISLQPSGTSGAITITASGGIFAATDVGRCLRLLSEPPPWLDVAFAIGDGVKDRGVYYGCVSAIRSPTGLRPGSDPAHWGIAPQNARWAWGTITSYISPTEVGFTFGDGNFIIAWNPSTIGASAVWRLGLYSDTTSYPTCGTYSDGRLWLSGAVPNRIDASVPNGIDGATVNFAPTGNGLDENDVTTTGEVFDNNAISYTFNATDVNPILWMTPDLQGIICGSKAGEWLVIAPTSGPLTPFNIAARRVTKIGCANIEPAHTEHTVVFVQKFARKIMEYFADVFSGKFTAPHLTFTAKHLTIGDIQEIAYQQELAPIVWARVDGRLRGCTYKRETLMTSQGPTAAGWHRHELGSGRAIESMVVGSASGGTTDALTIVTNDQVSGIRHVEVMSNILDEGSTLAEACYLDDAVIPSSTLDVAPTDDAPFGSLTLNGLWHLNGKTVTAWLGGLDCGDYTVANGTITVPYGDGLSSGSGTGLFTPDYMAALGSPPPMVVGFTYTSDGQIVRPNSREESGARSGPAFAKTRRSNIVGVLLEGAQGVSFGTTFAKLDPALFRLDVGTNYRVNQQFSGILRSSLTDDYSLEGAVCWRITRPYICNIAAIGSLLETQDA